MMLKICPNFFRITTLMNKTLRPATIKDYVPRYVS
jgi:hypothetical protein